MHKKSKPNKLSLSKLANIEQWEEVDGGWSVEDFQESIKPFFKSHIRENDSLERNIQFYQKLVAEKEQRLKKNEEYEKSPKYQQWLRFAAPEAIFKRDQMEEEDLKELIELKLKLSQLIKVKQDRRQDQAKLMMSRDDEWDL